MNRTLPRRPPLSGTPSQTEAQFSNAVMQAARLFRWRVYHTYLSVRSAAGFPDLVLARPPRLLFAELKSETGRFSEEQNAWLADLERCEGIEVYRWRPSNWDELLEALK